MRRATHVYTDPLDQIWLETAARIGLRVERRGDVYASLDGKTLSLGNPESLDPDMLDERARALLNYARKDDIIVFTPTR